MTKAVVKVSKRNRRVVAEYPSADAAAHANAELVDYIRTACRKKKLTAGEYYYRYATDFDPGERFDGLHNRPVLRVDELGRVAWYSCAAAAAKECYMTTGGIYAAITRNSLTMDGWRFAYAG